jgi:hypothetical protein
MKNRDAKVRWLSCWIFLATSLAIPLSAAEANTYESREAGFKITKPESWQFVPAHTVAQNLALPQLRDKELERAIRSKPNVPFLVMARFPTVDGQPAARTVARYTVVDAQGKEFKTVARMWVIPRGEYMFTVSMYGPPAGPNASEKEFEQILQSIEITTP